VTDPGKSRSQVRTSGLTPVVFEASTPQRTTQVTFNLDPQYVETLHAQRKSTVAVPGANGRQSRQKSYMLIEYDGQRSQIAPRPSRRSQIGASGINRSQTGYGTSRVSNVARASQAQPRASAYREFVPQPSIYVPTRTEASLTPEIRTVSFVRHSQNVPNLAVSVQMPKKSAIQPGSRLIEDTEPAHEEVILKSGVPGLGKSTSETGRRAVETSGVPRTSQVPPPPRASSNIPKKSTRNTFFETIQDDQAPLNNNRPSSTQRSPSGQKKVSRTPEIMAHLREFHPDSVERKSRRTPLGSPAGTTSSGYPATLTAHDTQPLGSTRKTASTFTLPRDHFCRFCDEYMHPECYKKHVNPKK